MALRDFLPGGIFCPQEDQKLPKGFKFKLSVKSGIIYNKETGKVIEELKNLEGEGIVCG